MRDLLIALPWLVAFVFAALWLWCLIIVARSRSARADAATFEFRLAIEFFLTRLAGEDDAFTFLELVKDGKRSILRRDWPEWISFRDTRMQEKP